MKRALATVPFLALALAVGGCGGSDEDPKAGGAGGTAAPSAPAPDASGPSGSGQDGGTGEAPENGGTPGAPPAASKATKAFNDCMAGQGVRIPTPTPGTTPSKEQIMRVKKAMEACVKKFSTDPPAG
ncbi:hypothetical protein [Actinomadura algeriensis]|uniref:Uncharacterized protein n=1 Tax=Actinomadura algeriensis TaxID=1679523 RepID=A0ABR9JKD5_9ACTN|nr:hypothetical protein [Actinomadura algeriensis]MBE1531005.1 hypothetical protein [Actinomadura algeriensis]